MKLEFNKDQDVFLEVADLMNNPELFLSEYQDLELKCDPNLLLRLKKWQNFFLDKFIDVTCFFSEINFALLEASNSNDIFKSQTTHEFELSLGFFDRLINTRIFINIDYPESAKYLLNISLIFSKYPGMAVGSFSKAFSILENGFNIINLQLLFESLFVKYESPKILVRHLNYLKLDEIDALMHILKGNNLRTFDKLPIKISKKESFVFMNELPENLSFNNSILVRALITTKLIIKKNGNPYLLNDMLEKSKTFETDYMVFYKDLNFWSQAFKIISQIVRSDNYFTVYPRPNFLFLQEFVDYFEFKKYIENTGYCLKNRTVNSLIQAVRDWHLTTTFAKNRNLSKLKWNRRTEKDISIRKGNTEYQFKELTTGKELLYESETLKHCVFTYGEYCSKGLRSIWSLQKKAKKQFKPYITIEVKDKSIVQLGGKHNRWLKEEETCLINEWAEIMGFENNCLVF